VIAVRALRAAALAAAAGLALTATAAAQSDRQVKVVLEFKQQAQSSRQGAQGQGGVIVEERSGSMRPRARGGLAVEDTTTRVTRSSGVFTVVQDGGAGSILVAQEVPYQQMAYYYDYAAARGYVTQGVAWQRVGTALAVRPVILPGNQIRVTLTPMISYYTPGGGGAIELVEAATEVIVGNGRRLQIGGSAGSLHAVTRQVLGYGTQQASQETTLSVLATIQ
jgi:hypothetical protein